jgi:hypothetical protein
MTDLFKLQRWGSVLLFFWLIAGAAPGVIAHVALDDPNGGELLIAGTEHTIVWHVAIGHDTLDWDLWYSTTGVLGPWITIVTDLPPGDTSTGSVHSYLWLVPEVESDEVRVRVRQDNAGSDYEDISDDDVVVRVGLFFADFDGGDLAEWSDAVP